MNELKCCVVRDLLPLYTDDVVSEDTHALVENHLVNCEECRAAHFAMKVKLDLPDVPDGAEVIKHVKRKWGMKQFWKGIVIAALTAALLFGGFLFLYGYGLPVKAEDVVLSAGLQCQIEHDRELGKLVPTGEQVWIMDVDTKTGSPCTRSEWVYAEGDEGYPVAVGIRLYVRRSPISLPWSSNGPIRHGMASSDDGEYCWTDDFTITVVCADQEITYSMKEEGLWSKDRIHDAQFCPMVGKSCPYSGQ